MVSVLDTYIESTQRIQPNQANNYENAHGGEIVRLMDELAAISAMTVASETCVTANIGSVDFKNPIPVGHVAELSAYVYDTGASSLNVRVNVESHDPRESGSSPTTSACFVMVAVDENGDPVETPGVTPETDRGEQLVAKAPCWPGAVFSDRSGYSLSLDQVFCPDGRFVIYKLLEHFLIILNFSRYAHPKRK